MGKDDTPSKKELARRITEIERLLAELDLEAPAPPTPSGDIELDCGVPELPPREMDSEISAERESLIRYTGRKWVNETVIKYYFFESGPYGGPQKQIDLVEQGFQEWRDVGIGLTFERVSSIDDAEVRIGFLQGDGYWSYVGTDVLGIGQQERTMNIGNDL